MGNSLAPSFQRTRFETAICTLIVFNSIVMSFEAQYAPRRRLLLAHPANAGEEGIVHLTCMLACPTYYGGS